MSPAFEPMTDAIQRTPEWKIHAILIEQDGRIVYEAYFAGEDERWGQPLGRVEFGPTTKHDLRSVTKSVVSALFGIARGDGAISSLDTPLLDHFPEYDDLQTPARRRITLRHALTMTAGLAWDEDRPYTDPRNDEIGMTFSDDPIRYALSREIVQEPGVGWRYSGGLTHLVAAVVERATGTPLRAFADTRLFAPLGIVDWEWLGDLAGMPAAASGLRLTPPALASFASLYLHGGVRNERPVVPADWVAESTRGHVALIGGRPGHYGYHWWLGAATASGRPFPMPMAVGNGEQRLFLLPPLGAAVTILAGRYNDFSSSPADDLLHTFIVPALAKRATSA